MSEPKKREWTVPEDLGERIKQRAWIPVDREEAREAELECEAIKHRLGGVVKSAAIRVKAGSEWLVIGHTYLWESFAPGLVIDLDEVDAEEPVIEDEAPELDEQPELQPVA